MHRHSAYLAAAADSGGRARVRRRWQNWTAKGWKIILLSFHMRWHNLSPTAHTRFVFDAAIAWIFLWSVCGCVLLLVLQWKINKAVTNERKQSVLFRFEQFSAAFECTDCQIACEQWFVCVRSKMFCKKNWNWFFLHLNKRYWRQHCCSSQHRLKNLEWIIEFSKDSILTPETLRAFRKRRATKIQFLTISFPSNEGLIESHFVALFLPSNPKPVLLQYRFPGFCWTRIEFKCIIFVLKCMDTHVGRVRVLRVWREAGWCFFFVLVSDCFK